MLLKFPQLYMPGSRLLKLPRVTHSFNAVLNKLTTFKSDIYLMYLNKNTPFGYNLVSKSVVFMFKVALLPQ